MRFIGVDEMPILANGSRTLDLDDTDVATEVGVGISTVALVLSTVPVLEAGERS